MPYPISYADLYAMLNDAEIAYLYQSDPKVPVRAIRADDPAPFSDPPLLNRHRDIALNRSYHGVGAWCSKARSHKRKH